MSKKRKKAIPPLMTLKVGPTRYQVFHARLMGGDDPSAMGECDYKRSRILLNTDYEASQRRTTLFHEAIHAVDQVYGIGLREEQVRALEVGLLNLIDDNPHLLAWEGV